MADKVAEFTPEGVLVIRPSSTNNWNDCQARTFAKAYPYLMISKGYELRALASHIGAVVGTSVHAGAEFMQRWRLKGLEAPKTSDAVNFAIARLEEEMGLNEVMWDDATPRINEAQQQIQRMLYVYRRDVADNLRVAALEERLEGEVAPGVIVSGQADVITLLPGKLKDIKTGKRRSYCLPQVGSYSALARAHGHQIETCEEDYIPRVPVTKEQPPVETIPMDRRLAESVALRTINSMAESIREFQETGDRHAFSRNPNSALCNERFCPLYGTKACPEGTMK